MLIAILLGDTEIVSVDALPIVGMGDSISVMHVRTSLSNNQNPEYARVLREVSSAILYHVTGTALSPRDDAHLDKVLPVNERNLFRFVQSSALTQWFGSLRCRAEIISSETELDAPAAAAPGEPPTIQEQAMVNAGQSETSHAVNQSPVKPVDLSIRRKIFIGLLLYMLIVIVLIVPTLLVFLGTLPWQIAVLLYVIGLAMERAAAWLGHWNNIFALVEKFLNTR